MNHIEIYYLCSNYNSEDKCCLDNEIETNYCEQCKRLNEFNLVFTEIAHEKTFKLIFLIDKLLDILFSYKYHLLLRLRKKCRLDHQSISNHIIMEKKLFRLENIDSCWDFIDYHSIASFTELFCNETLSKVYRLMIFSTDLKQNNMFLNEVKKAIEREAIKRNFDCFKPVKQAYENVIDVIYCQKKIIRLDDKQW